MSTAATPETPPTQTHSISPGSVHNSRRCNLQVNGHPAAFLDGPAGTQVPKQVMDAVTNYFLTANANTCGAFQTSRRNEAIDRPLARREWPTLQTGDLKDEVVFGTEHDHHHLRALSRHRSRTRKPGDEIVAHHARSRLPTSPPGASALEEKGIVIRQSGRTAKPSCTLDLDDLRNKITPKNQLVAVGYASNAVGTINPVAENHQAPPTPSARSCSSTPFTTRPTAPSTCKRARHAISSSARPTNSSARTWARSTASANTSRNFVRIKFAHASDAAPRSLGNRDAGSGTHRRHRRRRRLHRRSRPPRRSRTRRIAASALFAALQSQRASTK